MQGALETDQFPTATFILTEPVSLGAAATTGEAVSVSAVGDLTIHGVTNPVTFALEAQLVGDTIVVVGSTDIVFSDYDVQVPDSQVVVVGRGPRDRRDAAAPRSGGLTLHTPETFE